MILVKKTVLAGFRIQAFAWSFCIQNYTARLPDPLESKILPMLIRTPALIQTMLCSFVMPPVF